MNTLFEIGEEVVCVNNKSIFGIITQLKEGAHYFIKGFVSCNCGAVHVDVGIISTETTMICSSCYTRNKIIGVWPFKQERFVPLSHIENLNEVMEELIYADH